MRGVEPLQAPGRHGFGDPLQRQAGDRLGTDGVAHEPQGRLAEQNLARPGHLFQPSGEVDGLAGDEPLAGRGVAGHDLARGDTRPRREPHAEGPLELVIETVEGDAHLDRGTDGPECVVLVHDRHPEHRHDRVADELLHRPAVP